MSFSYFPVSGWATYANFASFPTTAPDGFPAYDLATNTLYAYDAGTLAWVSVGGGGGGTPAAPTNSIQYNNAGAFGGSSTLTFNGANTITFGTQNTTAIFLAPNATTLNTDGGSLSLRGGGGNGVAAGGDISIEAGAAGTSGAGGDVNLVATAGAGSGGGGAFNATAGSAGLGTADGGGFSLTAGNGGATAGNGGNFVMNAGGAIGGNSDGGGVYMTPGQKTGSGTQGQIHFGDPASGFFADFVTTGLTANRTLTFPNNAGVFALSVNGNFANSAGEITLAAGSGTVTSVSVVSANGFAGTVATATTTPAITLTTTNTTGSVLFASSTALGQDNANFFWDNTNKRLGLGTAAPISRLDVTTNAIGVTQTRTGGLSLVNTTAAAVGAQQMSPAMIFKGSGWKTNATAASQTVEARTYLFPVQSAANPESRLTFGFAVNGGAFTDVFQMGNAGQFLFGGTPGTSGQYLKSTGSTTAPAWTTAPWITAITSSDLSLTVSGGTDAIINVGHTNIWTIYQGYTESSHSSATAGHWWNDDQQHSMAITLSGSSTDNAIKVWPTGCFYSMYDQVIVTGTGEQEMMVQL